MSARDATPPPTTTTTTTVVRFSETDGQGVVFNGAYAYYADAALDGWLERTMGRRRALEARDALLAANSRWTFRKSARFMDRVDVRARVERWGNSSSFEVRYEGTIGGEACFEGAVTYVATEVDVRTGERKPVPVPEDIRRALGGTRARL